MGKWQVTATYQCVLSAETAQCICPHDASLARQVETEQEGMKQSLLFSIITPVQKIIIQKNHLKKLTCSPSHLVQVGIHVYIFTYIRIDNKI